LLDRPTLEDYRREWTELVARRRQFAAANNTTAVIFRLAAEWLALPTQVLQEVAEPRPIHSLPHRKDGHVLGLANVRGELMLCVSLGHWLQLDNQAPREILRRPHRRLLVTNWSGHSFAFPADFIHGTHRFNLHDLQPSPATLAKSGQACLQGVLQWQGRAVGFLDADQVFSSLNRSLL
jgi:chemotaxis-related protein WspD